jgi:hypothetical protein
MQDKTRPQSISFTKVTSVMRRLGNAARNLFNLAVLLAILTMVLLGVTKADFAHAPKTPAGIFQAYMVGELQATAQVLGVELPTSEQVVDMAIDLGARLFAKLTVRFSDALNAEYNHERSGASTGAGQ